MNEIDEIERKISELYDSVPEQILIDVPFSLQFEAWMSFSKSYLSAAAVVENEKPQNWLPIRQLLGQSIELALKACIFAEKETPGHGHNLIELIRICDRKGYKFKSFDIAAIIHLNHFYFKDLSTESKFKSRYPTNNNEALGGVVPEVKKYASIVDALQKQAEQKMKLNL
ncbi:MAG: HEPN domain-containing protein [Candidatus Thiodiazotropha sp.]